jgi:hypothetical protein
MFAVSNQELHFQLLFERFDGAAQGWLCDGELAGGSTKM